MRLVGIEDDLVGVYSFDDGFEVVFLEWVDLDVLLENLDWVVFEILGYFLVH